MKTWKASELVGQRGYCDGQWLRMYPMRWAVSRGECTETTVNEQTCLTDNDKLFVGPALIAKMKELGYTIIDDLSQTAERVVSADQIPATTKSERLSDMSEKNMRMHKSMQQNGEIVYDKTTGTFVPCHNSDQKIKVGDKVRIVGPLDKEWHAYCTTLENMVGKNGVVISVSEDGYVNVDFGSEHWWFQLHNIQIITDPHPAPVASEPTREELLARIDSLERMLNSHRQVLNGKLAGPPADECELWRAVYLAALQDDDIRGSDNVMQAAAAAVERYRQWKEGQQ